MKLSQDKDCVQPLFRICNLTVGYTCPDGSVKKVLTEINWAVGHSEFWGLVGESGAGKTTLLLTLASLEHLSGEKRSLELLNGLSL